MMLHLMVMMMIVMVMRVRVVMVMQGWHVMACHQKLYLTKRSIFPGWIDPVLSTATVPNNTATAIWRSTKCATHSLLFANQ